MSTDNIPPVGMLYEPLEHERRNREVADGLRRFLIGASTGGIAVVLGVAGKLMDDPMKLSPHWAGWPITCFVASLVTVAISMILAKRRELARRKVAHAKGVTKEKPVWTGRPPMPESRTPWDVGALLLFLAGFVVALFVVAKALPAVS